MNDPDKDRTDAFLEELSALTLKHKMEQFVIVAAANAKKRRNNPWRKITPDGERPELESFLITRQPLSTCSSGYIYSIWQMKEDGLHQQYWPPFVSSWNRFSQCKDFEWRYLSGLISTHREDNTDERNLD